MMPESEYLLEIADLPYGIRKSGDFNTEIRTVVFYYSLFFEFISHVRHNGNIKEYVE